MYSIPTSILTFQQRLYFLFVVVAVVVYFYLHRFAPVETVQRVKQDWKPEKQIKPAWPQVERCVGYRHLHLRKMHCFMYTGSQYYENYMIFCNLRPPIFIKNKTLGIKYIKLFNYGNDGSKFSSFIFLSFCSFFDIL